MKTWIGIGLAMFLGAAWASGAAAQAQALMPAVGRLPSPGPNAINAARFFGCVNSSVSKHASLA